MIELKFLESEIKKFKLSNKRQLMVNGYNYYNGEHDILKRKRTAIGLNGELEEIKNLPNNRIVDNQYKKMVDQKANYLLGQPLTFVGDTNYVYEVKKILNKGFNRLIKKVLEDSLNCGIGWIYVYYDDNELKFKRIRPTEIIPGWKDRDHTELDYIIRIYEFKKYDGEERYVERVEVFDANGIGHFEFYEGRLVPIDPYHSDYFTVDGNGYNWEKLPFVAFKLNDGEIPLIKSLKSLQDGLNLILSNFQNQMEEDNRNTILILVNYDGENLGEFRRNLSTYGAVKVRSIDGGNGDVKSMQIEVNAENYKAILQMFKKAIIENAMGYDAKDDRLGANANQMNIASMYSDIDLDANNIETEYQASLEELMWFVNTHLYNKKLIKNEHEPLEIIFNRDMLMNENEIIQAIVSSKGILSNETLIAQHPWVDNVQEEIERVKKEQAEFTEPSEY